MWIIFMNYLAGIILGCGITIALTRKKPIGILRVDNSDPDGPYLFLELKTDPNEIVNESYVTLKVNTKSYISQQ